jgi:UDP-N-acetylglucosamine transferase subunit ALG13
MIFVTVGSNEARFDRLLESVCALPGDEELVVQHGPSLVHPPNAECHAFLTFDEIVDAVRRARVVVSHAGVGSVLVALGAGKRPVVVPRLKRLGEAVDDHQVAFARRLHDVGLVTSVEHTDALAGALAATPAAPAAAGTAASTLADDLHRFLVAVPR